MPACRTAAKLIRFAPDELARITARAYACGRTPARFIRETALGAVPKTWHHADRDALLRELARIASSLTRLLVLSQRDDTATVSEQLAVALEAHRAALRSLVDRGRVEAAAR
ncbi:MAG: hypothetical protein ABI446_14405 [Gemmatimonadaceae bacterium]